MAEPRPLSTAPPPAPHGLSAAGRIRLATFLSPAFPVGAFSYSHGLEWALDCGTVKDSATLSAWIADLLRRGSFWCDAVLLKCTYEAAAIGNNATLLEIGVLAEALAPSRERHLETMAMGEAFLAAVRAAWPGGILNRLFVATSGRLAYPVAVGAVAADHAIPLTDALPVYLNAVAANLISVAVRLVPLGQSDGQRALADLEPAVRRAADQAIATPFEAIGSAAPMVDLTSMQHETQYTRLFRS